MDRLELLDPRSNDFSRDMDQAGDVALKIAEVFGRYDFLWNPEQPQQEHEEMNSTGMTHTTSQQESEIDADTSDAFLAT